MPKCTFVVPFDKFHGRILDALGASGQVAFSTATGGNISRKYVIPANPESTNQGVIRGYLTAAAAAYKALTQSEAAEWQAAAATVERENILNLSYTLTGIGLYCMVNSYRLIAGEAQTSTVPSLVPPIAPASLSTVGTPNAGTTVGIGVTATGMTSSEILICRVSAPLPSQARRARMNEIRFCTDTLTEAVETVSGEAATFDMTANLTTYDVGDRVGVHVQALNSDYFPGGSLFVRNVALADLS